MAAAPPHGPLQSRRPGQRRAGAGRTAVSAALQVPRGGEACARRRRPGSAGRAMTPAALSCRLVAAAPRTWPPPACRALRGSAVSPPGSGECSAPRATLPRQPHPLAGTRVRAPQERAVGGARPGQGGDAPYFPQTLLRRPWLRESWAPSGRAATYTSGGGVSLRVAASGPSLHLTARAVTSSLGKDQTAFPERWQRAGAGRGPAASGGTISPLSSISKCIIYEPPHLGAPCAPRASKQVCNRKGRPV